MKKRQMKVLFGWLAAFAVGACGAFDWPAAGGTATIPAGSLVEVTSTADLTAASKCGAIVVETGATLSFTNITANATFAGSFSGGGTVLAVCAAGGTPRLTFTGDLSGFTGPWSFRYVYATFNTPNSGTFPMTYVEENKTTVIFTGANTYSNPIDFNGGANQGLQILGDATYAGAITWRGGSIRGVGSTVPSGGGTITGSITCPNNSIYIQNGIKMLGEEIRRSSSGGSVLADGGPLDLKAKIVNFTTLSSYRTTGLITFLADNLVPDNCTIQFGTGSYAGGGGIDLNGFNQRCGSITHGTSAQFVTSSANTTIDSKSGPATLTILNQAAQTWPGRLLGHVSLSYESASANLLTITGTVHTTDGAIRAKKGKLAFGPASTFTKLTELEVSGTGALTLNNGAVNPNKVLVTLADSGVLTLAAGVTVEACRARVDGAYLAPGVYTKNTPEVGAHLAGDGTLRVLNGEPVEEGATFVWTGAGADTLLTTAENWKDGVAPTFDGTERLVFGEGTAEATVVGAARVYAVDIVTNAAFTLNAQTDAKLVLGEGGLSVTNTAASGIVKHVLNVPIEVATLPQTWLIAANAQLEANAAWSGPAGGAGSPLLVCAFGRVLFKADNSALLSTLVLTNCTTIASQPYVYNDKALGSPTRETVVVGCLPRFMTSTKAMTNNVPLRIRNGVTNAEHGYWNDTNDHPLYLDALVTYFGSSSSESFFHGVVRYRGGIIVENNQLLTLRFPSSGQWIEGEKGITSGGTFALDYGGTFNLASTNNIWNILNPYKCTVKLHNPYVLARGKPVRLSDGGVYAGNTTLDINGFDQCCSRVYFGLPVDKWGTNYGTVKSETPAMLEIAQTGTNNDTGPLKFSGQAGLLFNAPGSFAFTNYTSDTTGTLEVRKGTVKFLKGSGWVNTTNVVIGAEGTIDVQAGATAFGTAQGRSTADLSLVAGGRMTIAANETPTVHSLTYVDADGKTRCADPGTYGALGGSAKHKVDWITGGGTLLVLSSTSGGTILLLR